MQCDNPSGQHRDSWATWRLWYLYKVHLHICTNSCCGEDLDMYCTEYRVAALYSVGWQELLHSWAILVYYYHGLGCWVRKPITNQCGGKGGYVASEYCNKAQLWLWHSKWLKPFYIQIAWTETPEVLWIWYLWQAVTLLQILLITVAKMALIKKALGTVVFMKSNTLRKIGKRGWVRDLLSREKMLMAQPPSNKLWGQWKRLTNPPIKYTKLGNPHVQKNTSRLAIP